MTRRLLILLTLVVIAMPLEADAQSLRGTVVDRETGMPVAGAVLALLNDTGATVNRALSDSAGRFRLPDALMGFHTLEVTTPAHDDLSYAYSIALTLPDTSNQVIRLPSAEHVAASMCSMPGGIIAGGVRAKQDSSIWENVNVVVEWSEPAALGPRSLEATTDSRGKFRICGIPVNTPLVVRAEKDGIVSAAKQVRIPPSQRLASTDLVLDRTTEAAPAVVFSGVVSGLVSDLKGQPIAEAEVALQGLALSTLTNDRGEFRLSELPPGSQELLVRRIGYGQVIETVNVPRAGSVERKIVLSRVTTLEPVAVSADPVLASFEENRRIGLGRFLTRAQLEKQENRKMAEILEQIGAPTLRNGPRAWVGGGSRGPKSLANQRLKCVQLEGRERSPAGCECFAQVYVNDALIFNGEKGGIVPDVNGITPSSIEAIEYYKGAAQTPLKYSRLNSHCGVLVLHTRRTPGSTNPSKP